MKQAGLGRQGVWEAVGRPLTHTPLERLGALQKFPSGGPWPPAALVCIFRRRVASCLFLSF